MIDDDLRRRELSSILPTDFSFIDAPQDDAINKTPFNTAVNGLESEHRFTDQFAREIADIQEIFHKLFAKHGEYGSLDRYDKGLESDWWIGDDFYSTSRVLSIDVLNPNILTAQLIQEIRDQLRSINQEWMILLGHDNSYDSRGRFSDEDGEYRIWITRDRVRIYFEREKDIVHLLGTFSK